MELAVDGHAPGAPAVARLRLPDALGRIAATLAEGEGLTAHARSAEMRFK